MLRTAYTKKLAASLGSIEEADLEVDEKHVFTASTTDLDFTSHASVNLHDVVIDELRITIEGGIPESEIVDNLVLSTADAVPAVGLAGTIAAVATLVCAGVATLARRNRRPRSQA